MKHTDAFAAFLRDVVNLNQTRLGRVSLVERGSGPMLAG